MRHGPAQGWEQCPGTGQPLTDANRYWWRCPNCLWVGWHIRKTTPPLTPMHQRPIPQPPSTLF